MTQSFYEHLQEHKKLKGKYDICEYSRPISEEEFKTICNKFGGLDNIDPVITEKINETVSCNACMFKSRTCRPIKRPMY
jgi:hypothetical protein